MRIVAALDSIFRLTAEHEPWFPEPIPHYVHGYADDHDWQSAHLWDHYTETENTHGPYRGPNILHHPDLQYALDNGWRVLGGPKTIDHQSRGESGSGSPYLYKIDKGGLIHHAHLAIGPEDTHSLYDNDEVDPHLFDQKYGSVPEKNWNHIIQSENGLTSMGPEGHQTLRVLVDHELFRSADPTGKGYADYKVYPHQLESGWAKDQDWQKKYIRNIRRAWDTGTNEPTKHWDEPMEDPYADLDDIPRGGRRE